MAWTRYQNVGVLRRRGKYGVKMNTLRREDKKSQFLSLWITIGFTQLITFTKWSNYLNKRWKIGFLEVWFESRRICDSNQSGKWHFLKLMIWIIICTWFESNKVMIWIMFNFSSESLDPKWCSNFQQVSHSNQI